MAVDDGQFDIAWLITVTDGVNLRVAALELVVERVVRLATGGQHHGIDALDGARLPGDDIVYVDRFF
jgi:hypothetical protein